jgi:selenium-binding protein 1
MPPPEAGAAPPAAAAAAGCCHGPGYATPLDAMARGPREGLIFVPCIAPDGGRPDYLATVDVDPASATFSKVREGGARGR